MGSRLPLRLVPLLGILLALPPVAPARGDPAHEAESLFRRARTALTHDDVEHRRVAALWLERAALLAPQRADIPLELGQLEYRQGFYREARLRFERVLQIERDNAAAFYGLGEVWRRDYLKYLDRASLGRAIENYQSAARLDPTAIDVWLRLAPLLLETQDLPSALDAAERAYATDRGRPDALLALGHLAFRSGQIGRADTAFHNAIPRLPRIVRERFEDIAPVASAADTATLRRLGPAARTQFLRRFWAENDPDPVTRENEAQLEYWSRVAQAYFLYFDSKRENWDERGEVYVRYGPPEAAAYNPVGSSLSYSFATGPGYPLNVLVWHYPNLGMEVTMQDRLLSEYYLLPIDRYNDLDPLPDPDSLAKRSDALASRSGRAVFPVFPPGARPVRVDGAIARFEGDQGPRLVALLEAPAEPADSLTAEWVVLDSTRAEVARTVGAFGPSPCDAGGRRMVEFAAALPPGEYVAGVSVHGQDGKRGVFRAPVTLARPTTTLALSDIVVSCGAPEIDRGAPGAAPAVRLAANPGARVVGHDPLTVYFEMYHLKPGVDGRSRFEFEYTVRSAEKDSRIWIKRLLAPRREVPPLSATRQEEQQGALRRQFVTVPVQSLPDGRYRLEVVVRDLVAGTEARGSADFAKQAQAPGS